MPSTHLNLHYHLVFATKRREAVIGADWRARLHDYLGGTVSGFGPYSQGIGGMGDHVHLLVGLKAIHSLADFMRELKKASSVWVHQEIDLPTFAWQEGYAVTVSAPARAAVRQYIANQEDIIERVPPGKNCSTCWRKPGLNIIPVILNSRSAQCRCDPCQGRWDDGL